MASTSSQAALRRHLARHLHACALGACLTHLTLHAQTLTWDANTSNTGVQNGSGTWNTSTLNWWNGTTNVSWANSPTAIADIGVLGGVNPSVITIAQDIQLTQLNLRSINTTTPASGTQYTLNGDVAGRVIDFGSGGLIQIENFASGGSQFLSLGANLRLRGENLRVQNYGTDTAMQFINFNMTTNPELTGSLTIGRRVYLSIGPPTATENVSKIVVEAGGSAIPAGVGSVFTKPFEIAGFGNALSPTGTSYGALRLTSSNQVFSGGILLTAEGGINTSSSGSNSTNIAITAPITDGGNNFAFHRFSFHGNGTLLLQAANTYGGSTVLGRAANSYNGSVTILDFTAPSSPANDILYTGVATPGALNMFASLAATALRVTGKAGETHGQRLGNIVVSGTHNMIDLQPGASGAINLTSGTVSSTDSLVSLAISNSGGGSFTTSGMTPGLVGSWVTYTAPFEQRSWAQVLQDGTLAAGYEGTTLFSTGETLADTGFNSTSDVAVNFRSTGAVATGPGVTYVNSLSMSDGTVGRQIAMDSSQTLRLGTRGGIQLVNGAADLTVGSAGSILSAGGTVTATAGTLYLSNLSSTALLTVDSSIQNNGSGVVTLVVNGTPGSRTALTGANSHTGGTRITGGTLEVRNSAALGTTGNVVVVEGANATLALVGGLTINRPLQGIGGTGDGGLGAIRGISGVNTIAGLISQTALGSQAGPILITADAGSTLNLTAATPATNILTTGAVTLGGAGTINVTGRISLGSVGLTKTGFGLAILSGDNAYTGATTISAGILRLNHANALGSGSSSSGSVGITAGGTVDLNGFSYNRPIALNGTGFDLGGALINTSGTTSTLSGTAALGSATTVAGSGNVSIDNATGLTGNFLLLKKGIGTFTVGNSTTTSARTGTNQIDGGTLRLQSTHTTTAIAPIGTGAFGLNGGTLSLGFDVNNAAQTGAVNVMSSSTIVTDRATSGAGGLLTTLGALTIGNSTLTILAGGNIASGTAGLTMGSVTLGGPAMLPGNPTFDLQSTSTGALSLTFAALSDQAIAPRTITFQNSGSMASTLTLGTAATSLVDGTVINFANTGAPVNLNLNSGTALGSLSQLTLASGNSIAFGANTIFGSLAGGGTISPTGAFTLTLGNAANATNFESTFDGVLSNGAGTLTLVKAGKGTLTLGGSTPNTNSALTTVNSGTLILAKTGGAAALGGSLTIGVSTASNQGPSTVRLAGNEQLLSTADLTMNGNSTLDLQGYNQTLNTIATVFGANIIGTGTLAISRTSGTNTYGGITNFSANLQLTTTTAALRTIAVTNAFDVLNLSGVVSQGTGAGSITKSGSGTMVLSGDNTYGDVTTVSSGVLRMQHANALGSTTAGTTVASGGTVQLSGGITTAAELLTLNGVGFAGVGGINIQTGALVNASGDNTYTGLLRLGAAATVSADADTLTISNVGTITGATFGLTLTGAGDGRIDSVIGTTTGTVIKNGTGTWVLAGANSNTGTTTVNNGTLQLGDGLTGSWTTTPALSLGGSGRFVYMAATSGGTQGLGALTFSAGDGVVQTTYGGAGVSQLTFASLAARTVGATGNFVYSGGSPGTSNLIVLTGQTGDAFINQGLFVGGNAYAWYDVGGFVRPVSYGVDSGTATSAGGATLVPTEHQQITGAVTAQQSGTFTTLNVSGNHNLTLDAGQILTVNGLLKTGNTAGSATLSGGSGIRAASGAELVIRTDGGDDTLILETPILANGANALTKSGAGTLVLAAGNTYTGATNIAAGTLRLTGGGTLTTSGITIRNTGVLDLNGQSITNNLAINGIGAGTGAVINNSATPVQVGAITLGSTASIGGSGNITSNGALVGLAPIRFYKTGAGTLTFTVDSARTGPNQIDAGTVRLTTSSGIGTTAAQLILNGGTLSLGSAASVVAYPTAVTANSAIISDVASAGAAITHTLGALVIGGHTLTVGAGTNVTADATNAGVTFGSTALVGSPTFDVRSPTTSLGGVTTLSLGALNDRGVAKTLTFTNTGSSGTNSVVTLTGTASSLMQGTMVNLVSGPSAGVTLNLSVGTVLGALAQVSVGAGSVLNLGATQTLGSLSGLGTVTTSGIFTLTVGNQTSTPALSTTFGGALTNGAGTLALIKNGLGTLTLAGNNSYTGTTTISAGVLKLASATALGGTSAATVSAGATLDLNGQTTDRNITFSGQGYASTGALTNSSPTTATITGTTTMGAVAKVGGSGNITVNNATGLTGSALLTKFGSGTITFISSAASARSGANQIDAGTLRLQSPTALAPIGTGAMVLNGGTLSLGFDTGGTVGGIVNLLSNSMIVADRATPGSGEGITLALGNVTAASSTLTIMPGLNVTSGPMALTLGSVTMGGIQLAGGNPAFDVQGSAIAAMTLNLGALNDQAIAPRAITFRNTGAGHSIVNLNANATSLLGGTIININAGPGAGITVNAATASALGAVSQLQMSSSGGNAAILSLVASHTFLSLNGTGSVTSPNNITLTLGNTASPLLVDSVFNGTLEGAGVALVKNGNSSLTLGGSASNTYGGTTTINAGPLILAKTGGAVAVPGNLTVGTVGGVTGRVALRLDGPQQLSATSTLTVNAGSTFDLNGFNQSLGALLAPVGGTVFNGAALSTATLTVGGGNLSGTALGALNDGAGILALAKTGTGSFTVGGANTYSGGTIINSGTLIFRNSGGSATGGGGVTVSTLATLAGSGRLAPAPGNSISVAGMLSIGDTSAAAADAEILMSGAGSLTIQATGSLLFDLFSGAGFGDNTGNTSSADLLIFGGDMSLATGSTLVVANPTGMTAWVPGDSWRLVDWATLSGEVTGDFTTFVLPELPNDYYWDTSAFTTTGIISIVPEPARLSLAALGACLLMLRRRRAR